jgi:hypothetical protein
MRKRQSKRIRTRKNKRLTKSIRQKRHSANLRQRKFGGKKSILVYKQKYADYMASADSKIKDAIINFSYSPRLIDNNEMRKCHHIPFEIVKESTYSLLPYYFLSDEETFHQDEIVSHQNSGNCVSFAFSVLRRLETVGIYTGIIIPATLPDRLKQANYPYYGHVAVMLETTDKYIIFEPAYFILTPIEVPKDGSTSEIYVNVFAASWGFQFTNTDGRPQIIVSMKGVNGDMVLFHYEIAEIKNPSLSVSMPINKYNKRIPVVKFDAENNTKIAHLSIRLDTKKLEGFNIYNNNPTTQNWYEKFDWSKFCNESITDDTCFEMLYEWEGFSEIQCNTLGYEKDTLVSMVLAIIRNNCSITGGNDYTQTNDITSNGAWW